MLDAAGQIGGAGNASESVRYASLNGVKRAMPRTNGGMPVPAGIGYQQPGAEIDNRPVCEIFTVRITARDQTATLGESEKAVSQSEGLSLNVDAFLKS